MSDQEDTSSCYTSEENDSGKEIETKVFDSFEEALEENVKWWFQERGDIGHFLSSNELYTRDDVTGEFKTSKDLLRELNKYIITHDGQSRSVGEDLLASPEYLEGINRPDLNLTNVTYHSQQTVYLSIICTPKQVRPITKAIDEIGAYYVYGANKRHSAVMHNYPPFDKSRMTCYVTKKVFATGDSFGVTNVWNEVDEIQDFDSSVISMNIFGQENTETKDLLQALLNAVKD